MCGIVGYVGGQEAVGILLKGLRRLEYRGYDSAGVAVQQEDGVRIVKSGGRLQNLEERLVREGTPAGRCGIGHTRWATHGEPSDLNAHPHGNGRIALVHNGIIENERDLRTHLEHRGVHFETQTDTEAVVKLLELCYRGDPEEALRRTVGQLRGSYALAVLFHDFPGRIYAIRKDSPLIVGLGCGENFVASDIPAILNYTSDYLALEENELAVVTADRVAVSDWAGEPVDKPALHADWSVEDAEKKGFPHFMLKEIHEEPQALRDTLSPCIKNGLPCFPSLEEALPDVRRLHLVGCGTAMHAGMIGKNAVETLARIPSVVAAASEFHCNDPILLPGDACVFLTQSGETADTRAALRLVKARGLPAIGIVNAPGSSVARESDHVLYTRAGPEISVASTKAYTAQTSLLLLLAVWLGRRNGRLGETRARELTAALGQSPFLIGETLRLEETVGRFAAQYQNAHDLFFIGRSLDYALSLEGSLKLKEITYLHSEAYAAGELKHGPISLVTSGTPVVALATQPPLYGKMISAVREVIARGAAVLIICGSDFPELSDGAVRMLRVPPCDPLLAPLPAAALLQLFAYHIAVLRGCDVDHPRNLAKSVTVE